MHELELKFNFIKKCFDKEETLWQAFTEYMRFEAIVEYKMMTASEKEIL